MNRQTLILAGAVAAALLSACGGNGVATQDPPRRLDPPPLDSLAAPRLAASLAAVPATSATNPLVLGIEDGQAKVCQLHAGTPVCAVVEAPVPANTLVSYRTMPEGTGVLAYTRAPGAAYVDSAGAIAFQAAFNGAARAVEAYGMATATGTTRLLASIHSSAAEENPCDEEDASCDGANDDGGRHGDGINGGGVPVIEIPGWPSPWGGSVGGGGGGGDGGNTDAGQGQPEPEPAPPPVVVVRGAPDPLDSVPVVVVSGVPLSNWLPGASQAQLLAAADTPNQCTDYGIAVVCVRGKRPGLGGVTDDGELRGPTPWFPQSWCNFWSVLCSAGQVPADRPPPAPEFPPVQPQYGPRFNPTKLLECMQEAENKALTCDAMKNVFSQEQLAQCLKDVSDKIDDCNRLYGGQQ